MSMLQMERLGEVVQEVVSPRINEAQTKRILSFKVTFQEISLIGTWIMNVQEGCKIKNI